MTRNCSVSVSMASCVKFDTVITGLHVCKQSWSPKFEDELACKKDDRKEANEYHEYDGGVYKEQVGHVPIELSSLK